MAMTHIQPVAVADYRRAATSNANERQDTEWQWIWDAQAKRGKWILGKESGALFQNSTATKFNDQNSSRQNCGKVTLDQIAAEERQESDSRAAQLRRESQRRLKNRELLAKQKEIEEGERIRRVLEDRKREIEEKRALITAGPRVKPPDITFDNVLPAVIDDEGEGVMKMAPKRERPAWNAAVGPNQLAPRVGFQPPSLVPPPPLPQRRPGGRPGPPCRPTSDSSNREVGREDSLSSRPNSKRLVAVDNGAKAGAAGAMKIDIDEALAKADRGIERARVFSTITVSEHRGEDYEADWFAQPNSDHLHMVNPNSIRHTGVHKDLLSGQSTPNIVYFNNQEVCSAPSSLPCSEAGSALNTPARRAAGGPVAGHGGYRRMVGLIKEQIEDLKKGSKAASDTASVRSGSPTPSFLSQRSGNSSHSCSSRSTRAESANSHAARSDATRRAYQNVIGDGLPPMPFISEKAAEGPEQNPLLWKKRGPTNSNKCERYPAVPSKLRNNPNLQVQVDGPEVHVSKGASKAREGLIRAQQQAALIDSLDLDSPAHRPSNMHQLQGFHQKEKQSLVDSLDLSTSCGLSGMMKADEWLRRAVDEAIGGKDRKTSAGDRSKGLPSSAVPGRHATLHEAGAGEISDSAVAMRCPHPSEQPAYQGGTRVAGLNRAIVRKSSELIKRFASDAERLIHEYRGQQSRSNVPPQPPSGRRDAPLCAARQESAGGVEADIDEEEAALMRSIARLDRQLASAADPAAAYVAASDLRNLANRVGKKVENHGEEDGADGPAPRKLAPCAPLEHWNRMEQPTKQESSRAPLAKVVPTGVAAGSMRDRRGCTTKNK